MDNIKESIKRKKTIALAVVLLVLAVGILLVLIYQNVGKNKITYVDEATRKIGESQIPQLKDKTVAEPNNPDAWRSLGRAEYLSGNPEAAAISFNKALALNSSDPQFYVDLGRVYEAEGDLVKAEGYYKKAIELNGKEIKTENPPSGIMSPEQLAIPKSYYNIVTPYIALGNLYLKSDKTDEAIKVLELGIAMDPKYPDFYQLLSVAYGKAGDQAKAAKAEKKFKELIPNVPATP